MKKLVFSKIKLYVKMKLCDNYVLSLLSLYTSALLFPII